MHDVLIISWLNLFHSCVRFSFSDFSDGCYLAQAIFFKKSHTRLCDGFKSGEGEGHMSAEIRTGTFFRRNSCRSGFVRWCRILWERPTPRTRNVVHPRYQTILQYVVTILLIDVIFYVH